jgi:2-polyprenyl-3-methyl-5-hydroxy-6-metoxy-1,4-benzoquinol methylase
MKRKCYLCKSDLKSGVVVATKKEIRHNCYNKDKKIIKCGFCGLVQLIPTWSSSELNKIYKNYSSKKDFIGQKITNREYPKYIDKFFKKNQFILEVGCGLGGNIKRLLKQGYTIRGIDKDKSVCDGKKIVNLDVEELVNYKNMFDIVYGIHFLEHLENPLNFINNTYQSLTNNGKLILEIPNVEEPLLTIWENKSFSQYYWRPDHLFFYDYNSIIKLITKSSFNICEIVRKQKYGIFNHLNWLIRKKPTNNNFYIPILDDIYKFILTRILKKSDSLIIILKKD